MDVRRGRRSALWLVLYSEIRHCAHVFGLTHLRSHKESVHTLCLSLDRSLQCRCGMWNSNLNQMIAVAFVPSCLAPDISARSYVYQDLVVNLSKSRSEGNSMYPAKNFTVASLTSLNVG